MILNELFSLMNTNMKPNNLERHIVFYGILVIQKYHKWKFVLLFEIVAKKLRRSLLLALCGLLCRLLRLLRGFFSRFC